MGLGLTRSGSYHSGTSLERLTEEGKSPVDKMVVKRVSIQSSAGHEESGMNEGGPSPKAKYDQVTDREVVPWGKDEKNPGRGVK